MTTQTDAAESAASTFSPESRALLDDILDGMCEHRTLLVYLP